ncbi:MAG: hypothetical protein KatS3mg108_2404 [Isosphaeraceae bacterium]|jgi:hypothetical protein|nr:MAG: hypothetical protein KatS3mg108_2404 [Isosphaeraceae bacterium]
MRGRITTSGPPARTLSRIATATVVATTGCSLAPKSFLAVNDPAPLVRARAVGMGDHLSDATVIPTLIARLDDPDGVVRMTAIEELKRRTGQDFGYVPWAGPEDRARSVAAWRGWWRQQSATAWASPQSAETHRLSRAEDRRFQLQRRRNR